MTRFTGRVSLMGRGLTTRELYNASHFLVGQTPCLSVPPNNLSQIKLDGGQGVCSAEFPCAITWMSCGRTKSTCEPSGRSFGSPETGAGECVRLSSRFHG